MGKKILLRVGASATALVAASVLGLTAYAYLGDLSPEQVGVAKPVTLNAD